MKRGLKADLELCNKATLGPWEYLYEYSYENDYPRTIAHRVRIGEETLTIDTHDPNWEGAQEAISNAKFIAQARQGWPHAIERALEAEKRVEELENQVDILSTTLNMYCSPYYDMQERAEKAEALNRELAEALEKAIEEVNHPICGPGSVVGDLEEVLDKAKEVLRDEQSEPALS